MKEKESRFNRLLEMSEHDFTFSENLEDTSERIDLYNKAKAIRRLKEFDQYRLHPDKNCTAPPSVLTIGGKQVATKGNLSLILGKAKSGKTFLVTTIAAALISDKPILKIVKGHRHSDSRKVLLIDTEQTKYHATMALNRIENLAGKTETFENLVAMSFRSFNFKERRDKLNQILQESDLYTAVILDGIRDFIADINNPEQVSKLIDDLLRWSQICQTHIICVLHENKNDGNARGHLGSELVNKAESTLHISKDSFGERVFSKVKPEMCRNQEFDDFAFEIINSLPALVEDIEIIKRPVGP